MRGANFENKKKYDLEGHQHCSDPNLYIFVVYDGDYYKMTAVTLSDARASSKPPTPIDKHIRARKNNVNVTDDSEVCKMWDGSGHATKLGDTIKVLGTGIGLFDYELKNVKVTGCGVCLPN